MVNAIITSAVLSDWILQAQLLNQDLFYIIVPTIKSLVNGSDIPRCDMVDTIMINILGQGSYPGDDGLRKKIICETNF